MMDRFGWLFTWVRKDGQVGGDEADGTMTGPPRDPDDCIKYLEASCRTEPSLRVQKCSAIGLDSMLQSSDTVDPSGAPISCWCSVTDGATVIVQHIKLTKQQGRENLTETENQSRRIEDATFFDFSLDTANARDIYSFLSISISFL